MRNYLSLLNRMRCVFLPILLCLVIGCGGSSDFQVYDIAANPDDFPQKALDMLSDIETRKLADYESVVRGFEDLYESHLDLLDNPAWISLITRLGGTFSHMADSVSALGVTSYYQAGGLYALASFATPEDSRLRSLKESFQTWRSVVDSTRAAQDYLEAGESATLPQRLSLLKEFYLADSTHRAFAAEYLETPLLSPDDNSILKASELEALPALDQAFLAYAGLRQFNFDEPLASFENPRIDLIDCQITRVYEGWYRVETYWVTRDSLTTNFDIALRIPTPDSSQYTVAYKGRQFLPYDFRPIVSADRWAIDSVEAAVQEFYHAGDAEEVGIGLYPTGRWPIRYAPVVGGKEQLMLLPPSVFSDQLPAGR